MPLLISASIMITACESAAMTRLRSTNRKLRGGVPAGYSLARQPPLLKMFVANCELETGAMRSTPQGNTATVVPPAARQPRWAAVSQPRARPLTIAKPEFAACAANAQATAAPPRAGRRVPTMATPGRERSEAGSRTKSGRPEGRRDGRTTACGRPPARLTSSPGNSTQKTE